MKRISLQDEMRLSKRDDGNDPKERLAFLKKLHADGKKERKRPRQEPEPDHNDEKIEKNKILLMNKIKNIRDELEMMNSHLKTMNNDRQTLIKQIETLDAHIAAVISDKNKLTSSLESLTSIYQKGGKKHKRKHRKNKK